MKPYEYERATLAQLEGEIKRQRLIGVALLVASFMLLIAASLWIGSSHHYGTVKPQPTTPTTASQLAYVPQFCISGQCYYVNPDGTLGRKVNG